MFYKQPARRLETLGIGWFKVLIHVRKHRRPCGAKQVIYHVGLVQSRGCRQEREENFLRVWQLIGNAISCISFQEKKKYY